jgi:L-seryl-tRNA(Ser) seleniumtransferase
MSPLNQLPAIDHLLGLPKIVKLLESYGRPLTLEACRAVLDQIRQAYIDSKAPLPDEGEIITRVRSQLEAWLKPSLIPLINAAGVILHTNLGRAPLSLATRKAISEAAQGYTNLEFNLEPASAANAPCMPAASWPN